MALVRCKKHGPTGRVYQYVKEVEPLGYPNGATICGIKGCMEQGLVYLCQQEAYAYEADERVFYPRPTILSGSAAPTGAKVRVC